MLARPLGVRLGVVLEERTGSCCQLVPKKAVDTPVRRTRGRAGDVRTDAGQQRHHPGTIQHRNGVRPGIVPRNECGARVQLAFRQAQVDATALLERGVDAGLPVQARRQFGPASRRLEGPQRVGRKVDALAPYPDQAEVAARGTQRTVCLLYTSDAADE